MTPGDGNADAISSGTVDSLWRWSCPPGFCTSGLFWGIVSPACVTEEEEGFKRGLEDGSVTTDGGGVGTNVVACHV